MREEAKSRCPVECDPKRGRRASFSAENRIHFFTGVALRVAGADLRFRAML
jgi:hypothetical protein